mmetsp:Transcript_29557/g.49683  ORF Transcript_29557/g.49683 Transcript_29557/m.49683 type:complete len:155 (+) Transcript_29557:143-607(+)
MLSLLRHNFPRRCLSDSLVGELQRVRFLSTRLCPDVCSAQTPLLTPSELGEGLRSLPLWTPNTEQTVISRTFVAKNFVAAIKFFNSVAEVAEREKHHPNLHLTNFREVAVELQTHAIGGLSALDLALATKVDAIEVEYSPAWLLKQQAQGLLLK